MKVSELIPQIEGISVAITKTSNSDDSEYGVYLLNLREDIIEGIIISSVGYGENVRTGEKIKTSVLRHTIELMLPNEAAKIEIIMPEVFGLYNEYWVSFWINDVLFDKKFVFEPNSILEEKMILIDAIGKKGILLS